MTGYGRGMAESGKHRVVVEMRSVNHRYLDLKIRGASVGPAIEDRLTKMIKARLGRGSVVLTIRLRGGEAASGVRVDVAAARRVLGELRKLQELGVSDDVSAEFLCSQPGVLVQGDDGEGDEEDVAECATQAAQACLEALVAMREAEGNTLRSDVEERLDRLLELGRAIGERVAKAPEDAQKRLSERIARLLKNVGVDVDPDRVAHEVAVVADRLDVTEELVRVGSHVEQAKKLLGTDTKPVGRRLDFLVQELGREFNTVTSKSQSAEVARLVVEGKAELEKIREQVQNVE